MELFVFAVFALFWCCQGQAATLHVDAASVNPVAPYESWSTAAQTIQDAADAAVAGDVVLVADGVYDTGGRAAPDYTITNRVFVPHGVTVRSVNGPEVTTIVGSRTDFVRCVMLESDAQLIGFTLTDGRTRLSGFGNVQGGGVYSESDSSIVSNCVIRSCEAHETGGGVSGGRVYNSIIEDNVAKNGGGVAYFASVWDSTIRSNTATQWGGGAYYYVSFYRCRIEGNTGGSGGGIVMCQAAASIIANNVALTNGGGVYFPGSPHTMLKDLNSCLIVGNHAGHTGGGVFNGGPYAQTDMKLFNCTVVDNTAVHGGGGVHFSYIYNTIVWDNVASNGITHNADQVSAHASCAPELSHGVNMNITNNPLFRAAEAGDYRLRWASPCRDTGAGDLIYTLWDLDGNDRVWCAAVDRGAYEYPACAGVEPDSASFPAGGGSGSFAVVMAGEDTDWVAVSSNHWITFSSASSGHGAGTVSYEVAANTGGAREGWLLLNDVPAFRVMQEERPTPPVIISGPIVTNITASGATVRWTTDLEADSRVAWSRYPASWQGVTTNETPTTEHEVVLTGLLPATDYRFMAMSSRGGAMAASGERFFRTRSLVQGFTITSNLFVSAGNSFPLAIQPETTGDVSFVDFFLDGQFIGRAFEPPFGIYFDPSRVFPGTIFTAGDYTISAVASDGFGVVTEVQVPWTFGAECAALDITVELWQPREGSEFVIGAGVPNPPTNFMVFVDAQIVDGVIFEMVDYPGGMGPHPPRDFVDRENIVKPERVELLINDELVQTRYDDIPEIPFCYEFDVDISGWSTGTYSVAARAVASNGCSKISRTSITLVEADVDLRITRMTERDGPLMITSLMVSNASARAVDLDQVMDRSFGFQPYTLAGPVGSISDWTYIPATREVRITHTFPVRYRMSPGDTLDFHAALIPFLSLTAGSPSIGASCTFSLSWDGAPLPSITRREPVVFVWNATNGLTETFADARERALRGSDYLIVLNPEGMMAAAPASPAPFQVMEQSARLASIRGGVLAYFHAHPTYSARFENRQLSTLGPSTLAGRTGGQSLLFCGLPVSSQLVAIAASGEYRLLFPISNVELRDGDALYAGNYVGTLGGEPHSRPELVLVQGDGWPEPGTATAYCYDGLRMVAVPLGRIFGYSNACAAVMGDFVDGGAHLPPNEAEMLMLTPENRLLIANNTFAGGVAIFDVPFGCGSLMAAGRVTGGMKENLVVADPAANLLRLYSFRYSGAVQMEQTAIIHQEIAPEDRLVVANLDGGAFHHIILHDAAERLLRLFRYDSESRSLVAAGIVTDVRTLEEADGFFAGDLFSGTGPSFILARGTDIHGDLQGDISLYPYGGSRSLGSRAVLRDRITTGWRGLLATNWTREGTVLLVGENDLIPAFSATVGGERIRETDRMYANVSGSASRPELAIGRIIGDTPEALSTHLTTILEHADGTRRNQMRSLYLVSGHPTGVGGGSSDINYSAQCNQMERIFTGKSIPVIRDRTDGDTAVALEDLLDKASTNDVFLFAGHGNWDRWDITTAGNVDTFYRTPADRAPLVLAKTCTSGRYAPGFSHGEAFIRHGALAYIGATAAIGTDVGLEFNKQMLRELGTDVTLGDMVKRAKRARSGIDGRNDFTCDVYHLYGDPGTLLRFPGRRAARRSAPRRADNEFEGAPTELTLHLPMYTVQTNASELHEVFLDGQTRLTLEGMPAVPRYTAFLEIPADKTLQSVTMTDRSGLVARSGLPLEPWYYAEDSGRPRRSSIPTPPASGFWPEQDMHWSMDEAPGGASTLILTVHPFFCNTNTAETLYYTNFTFALEYVDRQITINRVALDRASYETGDTVRIVGWLDAPDKAIDATVETVVQNSEGDFTQELPLQFLPGLRGLCSYSLAWDTESVPPGHYKLRTIVRDTEGGVHDRNLQYFSIGHMDAGLDGFYLEPETFLPGEEVELRLDVVNTGSDVLDGILIIEIRDAAGALVETLHHAISNLAAGATYHYAGTWVNHTLVPRNCQVAAYLNVEARTTPETLLSSWMNAPLFFQDVQVIQDGISMSWPSVAGRTYTLERSTNLLEGRTGFVPVESGIPATPPMNTHSNLLQAPLQFFRVAEIE